MSKSKPRSLRLPAPDEYGNYWFNGRGFSPAVLKSYRKDSKGKYFVTLECDKEVMRTEKGLVYFDSPEDAMHAMHIADGDFFANQPR